MSERFRLEVVVLVIGLTGAGLWAGRELLPRAGAEDARDGAAEEDHDDHDEPGLSAATLENLGVTVGALEPTDYARTRAVAALTVAQPATHRPVQAPFGGRVEEVLVRPGQRVEPGDLLATVLRDPIPRPELVLTAEVLKPAQEGLHETVVELRRSAEELRIAETELERVRGFTGEVGGEELPLLPRQREIELTYQRSRAWAAHERARHELGKHGLSEEQVDAIADGSDLPVMDEEIWKRALAVNGIWTEQAEALHHHLPEAVRRLPWVIATIGELAASGLASAELAAWIEEDPGIGRHFLDVSVLMLEGHTLEDLRRLHDLGAFEARMHVRAPAAQGEGGGWDVHRVEVRPGAHVAIGAELVGLHDAQELWLRLDPVGGEVATVLDAVRERRPVRATPLVRGEAPELEGLTVDWAGPPSSGSGTVAYADLENEVVTEVELGDGRVARTWALREGVRYLVHLPVGDLRDVYVLDPSAVARRGADRVVYLRDGGSFRPVPVRVLHEDARAVVLPAGAGATLFPGDEVALTGAMALGLALESEPSSDAGHGHAH